jgi:hypothetical protein
LVASIEVFPPWNKKSAVLQKAITSRQSNAATDPQSADPATAAKAPKDQEPIDWKKVAGQFAEMRSRGGMTDMQSMMKLQRRLQAMSKDEIGAAFETPAEAREMLEQMLISQLAEKDPEFTLKKFVDRLQERDGSMSWSLANAMQAWARKDPARAIAWFDQQIAAGKFDSKALDGKSQPRLNFEGSLINLLLDSDPSAAGSRLAALPQDQRHEALQSGFNHPLTAENEAAFAKLVRDHIPAEEQARTLAEKTSSLVRGDQSYKRVTEFLDRIQAPPPNAPNAPNAPPRTASHRLAPPASSRSRNPNSSTFPSRRKSPAKTSTKCVSGSPAKHRNPSAPSPAPHSQTPLKMAAKWNSPRPPNSPWNTITPPAMMPCSPPFSKAGPRGKTRNRHAPSRKKLRTPITSLRPPSPS